MTEEMTWDLSQLVDDTSEDRIIAKLQSMVAEAAQFRADLMGKVEALDAAGLKRLLERKDEMSLRYEGAVSYCQLRYAANSTDPVAMHLDNASRKAITSAGQEMAFLEIEMGRLLLAKPELLSDPGLSEYRHYLERIRRRAPHVLPVEQERLVMAKDQNGVEAWSKLQGDWLSTRTFHITVDGKRKVLPYGEIIGYYQNPSRKLRREANRVAYKGLGADEIVWSTALRSVCADHVHMCEWRKYPSPVTPSLIANDLQPEALDALMQTVVASRGVYRRYLRTKAKLMKVRTLSNWDITAPLPDSPDRKYTWHESRRQVVAAYASFDDQFAAWVDEMYVKRHIDGEVRRGKVSGAFCSSWTAGKSAYVLQSFNGALHDVYTQAHELGHSVHAYLDSRAQKPSNLEVGMCIAECGSIFGELLLTDELLRTAQTVEERRAIICAVMDEFGMAAFQVSARYFFEHGLYEAIKDGRYLDGETISALWVKARDDVYGKAVRWLPEMNWEWTMKLHYYMPNFRFYNYPYVFAQLFVFALYRLYKEEGKAFVPKMKALLSAGSSKAPADLARELGFDLNSEEFWMKGIRTAEEFVAQLEATIG
jgi:oligoendopeptidase F